MKPDRWQRIQDVFVAAMECAPTERRAFVERSCDGDADLLQQVASLIEASADGESLITSAVQSALELAAAEPDAGEAGARRRIGPYEIVRVLGEGGLAKVYLGERADEQFTMRVAIKVVKPGMDTADILRRLRQERQILASLDHPNIAQLFDGGTTDEGLPYFVMEHIEGEPIDEYCDRRSLSTTERLKLFRDVCSAVHCAHQNLVIHRDLKPSNLLVTSEGVPKLLDFGIAKLLDEQSPHTLARTAPGLRLLTPEYASPEQVLGLPLTTATDIYSLGVMLYRLLTGHPPYTFASTRPGEVERVIRETEPKKPSTVIFQPREQVTTEGEPITLSPESVSRLREGVPERLRKVLVGDLDNIVLMALRKEPHRRYASVEQLAEDLERTLKSLPILARQDTLTYRTGKFMRRNRGGVAAGILVLLALLGGIVTTARQAKIARDARGEAERHLAEARVENARAERASAFMVELFEISDPGEARGNEVTAREILDRGASKIRRELSGQPELKTRLMASIGQVYRNLGLYDEALELYQEVLDDRRQLLGQDHEAVARSLGSVAEVRFEKGEYATAEPLLRQALELQRRRLGPEHPDVATTLSQLASVLDAKGDGDSAERLFTEALEMRRRLLGEDHLLVAAVINKMGEMHYDNGRWRESEPLFRQALEVRLERLGEDHPEVAASLNNLASALWAQGEREAVVPLHQRLIELRSKLFGEESGAVAMSLNNLGVTLQTLERDVEAEPLFRRALAINEKVRGPEHRMIAANMNNLATSLRELGEVAEAEQLYRRALDMKRELFGDQHPSVTLSLFKLASFYAALDRATEAVPLFEETLRIQRQILPAGDFRISYPLLELARLRCAHGQWQAAEPLLHEAVEIRRQAFEEDHRDRVAAEELLDSCRG